jgi:nitrite reductase/ring-hydroxylating ferredoxin subunit
MVRDDNQVCDGSKNETVDLGRRTFVLATMAAAVCACCGSIDLASAQTTKSTTIDVGPLSDYTKDGVTDTFVGPAKILVIRNDGQLFACSAVCTHKGKPLSLKAGEIICKAHGSEFSHYGTVTKGPARDSLARYAISVKDGRVIVDTSKSFREAKWSDAASFIDVKRA